MDNYQVIKVITRYYSQSVEADSENDAEEKAEDNFDNWEFEEETNEYRVRAD